MPHISKSCVVSNGIDTDRFSKRGKDYSLMEKIGLKPDFKTLLYLGRLDSEKNVDVIIKSMVYLQGKLNVQMIIAGSGSCSENLKELADSLGVSNLIHFTGYVDDDVVPRLYNLSDIYLIASTAELQSITTLEAMSCTLPVIAADSNALKDIVKHGWNGYLFEPGNSRELSKYVDSLLSHQDLYDKMSQNARTSACEHDIKNTGRKYEEIYRSLLRLKNKNIISRNNKSSRMAEI